MSFHLSSLSGVVWTVLILPCNDVYTESIANQGSLPEPWCPSRVFIGGHHVGMTDLNLHPVQRSSLVSCDLRSLCKQRWPCQAGDSEGLEVNSQELGKGPTFFGQD